MKKLITITALLLFSFNSSSQGNFNVIIGQFAGHYLTTESYCVIVGHGEKEINAKGKDMIWIVDWDEPLLSKYPKIKAILLDYYNTIIKKGKDSKDYRIGLVHRIIVRNNVLIGYKATQIK